MALIIEDGTGKSDAQSYVSLAEFKTYAEARGFAFTATEAMLVKAMDYLETLKFVGVKKTAEQALSFPRVDPVGIPAKLKAAECQLAIAVAQGVDLMPTKGASAFVKREKVGPIETEYSETVGTFQTPEFPIVDSLLEGLIDTSATGGFFLNLRRV